VLGEILVEQAEHLLKETSEEETLISRVESALRNALRNGRPGLSTVCQSLGVSERSLQRELKNQGISFSGLLANVRRQLAELYLQDPVKSVGEIAYSLGYSDPCEFHRAFRVWTGLAPRQYSRLIGSPDSSRLRA